jgi:nicotinamide mononucleotide (NMN) deamidase PncC
LYPHDAEADTLERWAEVSAEVAKEMEEKTDTSSRLPDHAIAVNGKNGVSKSEGEAAAIASLPVSGTL